MRPNYFNLLKNIYFFIFEMIKYNAKFSSFLVVTNYISIIF